MTAIEGRLDIDLYADAEVEIVSSRPVHACRVMIGKQPREVLSLLPLMFNVCAVAQARTALLAIQSALGIEPRSRDEIARDLLVLVECAREDLMRVFVDWPRLFDIPAVSNGLGNISTLSREFASLLFRNGLGFALDSELDVYPRELERSIDALDGFLERRVFAARTVDWLQIETLDDLERWAGDCDSIAATALQAIIDNRWAGRARARCAELPKLDTTALLQILDGAEADEFIARPQWQGRCHETSVLDRLQDAPLIGNLETQFGRALITRWVARLVELASLPSRLRQFVENLETTPQREARDAGAVDGLAQVEAARGRLVHRVQISDGRVGNYQIVAPTEWNFHPAGLIRDALQALGDCAASERERLARIVISAIDPCVGYRLRMH